MKRQFAYLFLLAVLTSVMGVAAADRSPRQGRKAANAQTTVLYDAVIDKDIEGLHTYRVEFRNGLFVERFHTEEGPGGKPLTPALKPTFKYAGGKDGSNNQLVSGPIWDPGRDINNPQQYLVLRVPVKKDLEGGKIVLRTRLRAWNPSWTKDGAKYVLRFCYATSNNPGQWENVVNGGMVSVSKSGNVQANDLPVNAVIPLDDETIPAGGFLELRLSVYSPVPQGNIAFVERIRILHEK